MSKNKKHKYIPPNNDGTINTVDISVDGSLESLDSETIVPDPIVEENYIPENDETNIEADADVEVKVEESDNEVSCIDTPSEKPEYIDVCVNTQENNTKPVEVQPVITPVVMNFYKVGTDFIKGKCINQFAATTDLSKAKDDCDNARNTYKKSYHVFDKHGNAVYTAEYTIPRDNYYRVGTDWKSGACINQKMTSTDLEQSIACANDNTKITGIIHHVYGPSGNIVFSSKKKLVLLSYKKRGTKNVNWYT